MIKRDKLSANDVIEFARSTQVAYAEWPSRFSDSRKIFTVAFFPLRFIVKQGNEEETFTDVDRAIEWFERI